MMKNKVKLYGIIIGLVYTAIIVSALFNKIVDYKLAINTGYEVIPAKHEGDGPVKVLHFYKVRVSPKEGKRILNEHFDSKDTKVSYAPRNVWMGLDEDTAVYPVNKTVWAILFIVLILFLLVIIPYIPILFYQIIRRVVFKELLDQSVVRRILRMGWILVGYFVASLIMDVMGYLIVKDSLTLNDYNIESPQLNYMILMLGCLALFLGQVLKSYLQMKEEQDLTI